MDYSRANEVWVGNLAPDIDPFYLSVLLARFGKVVSAKVIKNPDVSAASHGFVVFAEPEAAQDAARYSDGFQASGQSITVKMAGKLKSFGEDHFPVFVGKVPAEIAEGDMKEHFSFFGEIVSTRKLPLDDGLNGWFLNFRRAEAQEEAVQTKKVKVFGNLLEISPYRPKTKGSRGYQKD